MSKTYSVVLLTKAFGVSKAGYYKWLNRSLTDNDIINFQLCDIITEYHQKFDGILGYLRMTDWINRDYNYTYNVKRYRRLMKVLDLKSRIKIKKKNYTKHDAQIISDNILKREFHSVIPNEKWVTDITEFKIGGLTTKLYLSAILDLAGKNIISYEMSTSNNNKLVIDTYNKAIELNSTAKPIFHSDRGFQYTSKAFSNMLKKQGIIQSMSRPGRCPDNAPIEAFWGILKSEMYYSKKFRSVEELTTAIHAYIHFYNNKRYQKNLKGLTPIEYRNQALHMLKLN